MTNYFESGWDYRDDYDYQDGDRKVVANPGDLTEEVAGKKADTNPEHRTSDAVKDEFPILHRPQAGYKRRKGADDRHEACEDNRVRAIFLKEFMRFVEVLVFEDPRIRVLKEAASKILADDVVRTIANDSCTREDHKQQSDVKPHVLLG